MRDLVRQVAEGHKNVKVAKEKLQKFKQNTGTPFHSILLFSPIPSLLLSFPCHFHSERILRAKSRTRSSSVRRGTSRAHPEI